MKLEKTPESPLDFSEIKPVGRIDAESEAPILWPPDVKSLLTRGKSSNAGKD